MGAVCGKQGPNAKDFRKALSYQRAFPHGIPDYFHGDIDRDESLSRITNHSIETGCFLIRAKSEMVDGQFVYVLSVIGPLTMTGNVGIKERIMHFLIFDDGRQFAIVGKHPDTGEEQTLRFDDIESLLERCDASNANSFLSTRLHIPAACPKEESQQIIKFLRDTLDDNSIRLAESQNNRRASFVGSGVAMGRDMYVAPTTAGSSASVSVPASNRNSGVYPPPLPRSRGPSASSAPTPPPVMPRPSTSRPQSQFEYGQPTYDAVEHHGPNANQSAGSYMALDGTQATYDAKAVTTEGSYTALQAHAVYAKSG
eukprot:TRINITY_DN27529_c0_g1_i1.p1 TRINITY_DN27529_c0_g1~~TRINITY_DN27529_c0_g1_i1.p1  ORF type:complete len:312 (+),score=58.59 TRINITY_DN27529_c0_g1_i1:198-1133(+)